MSRYYPNSQILDKRSSLTTENSVYNLHGKWQRNERFTSSLKLRMNKLERLPMD
jgi:hypothetical protein